MLVFDVVFFSGIWMVSKQLSEENDYLLCVQPTEVTLKFYAIIKKCLFYSNATYTYIKKKGERTTSKFKTTKLPKTHTHTKNC